MTCNLVRSFAETQISHYRFRCPLSDVPPSMETRRTILVIDDDPHVREALQMALDDRGYEVMVASDGEVGYVRALRDKPDLIICDMMMPRTSGFVVVERIKSHPHLRIPFIMLTGNSSDHQRAYAEFLGVDCYLNKPVRPHQLFEAVERLMAPIGVTGGITDPPLAIPVT